MHTAIIVLGLMFVVTVGIPFAVYLMEHDLKLAFATFGITFTGIFTITLIAVLKSGVLKETEDPIRNIPIVIVKTIQKYQKETPPKPQPVVVAKETALDSKGFGIPNGSGVIYFGDSRTNGMNIYCHISDATDRYVVAKDKSGYDWASTKGLSKIKEIMQNDPHNEWVIICLFGVNDPDNINRYIDLYESMQEIAYVIAVTPNPLTNSKYIKNENLENFNEKLKSSGLPCMDTYSVLAEEGFNTVDGIHYDEPTYTRIYNYIEDNLL